MTIMDGRQLREYLRDLARENGERSLTPRELDYLHGRITYNVYLDQLYVDYSNGAFTQRSSKLNQGFEAHAR